jgi:hypothetical protein
MVLAVLVVDVNAAVAVLLLQDPGREGLPCS